MSEGRTTVYTDGACLGNPGPGGWAWAVPGGRWRSGAAARTTNQRMEIAAALDAARCLSGPLEVVSDSTYVVNCFKRQWWRKWVTNGWVSSARQPVANRDLWEPLVELYRAEPGRLEFRWVKGHSTDPFNDLVDRLAVAAASSQHGAEGDRPPGERLLGPADAPGHRAGASPEPGAGSSPRVRSGRLGDSAAVARLWHASGAGPGSSDDVARVRALVGHDAGALIVAEGCGEAAGGVIGAVVACFDGWEANLYGLAVDLDRGGTAVALALVAEAERRLVERGAKRAGAIVSRATDCGGADGGATTAKLWRLAGYVEAQDATRYVKELPGS